MYACNGYRFQTERGARDYAGMLFDWTGKIAAVEFANMLPQSQEEQESERDDLAALLSCTRWTVDRCRHETCQRAALWVMDGARQVGVIARQETTGKFAWYAQKLIAGQPVTNLSFETLSEAAAYAVRCFD